jgi:hypothetical protein
VERAPELVERGPEREVKDKGWWTPITFVIAFFGSMFVVLFLLPPEVRCVPAGATVSPVLAGCSAAETGRNSLIFVGVIALSFGLIYAVSHGLHWIVELFYSPPDDS